MSSEENEDKGRAKVVGHKGLKQAAGTGGVFGALRKCRHV